LIAITAITEAALIVEPLGVFFLWRQARIEPSYIFPPTILDPSSSIFSAAAVLGHFCHFFLACVGHEQKNQNAIACDPPTGKRHRKAKLYGMLTVLMETLDVTGQIRLSRLCTLSVLYSVP
jgi:hypothetical protein